MNEFIGDGHACTRWMMDKHRTMIDGSIKLIGDMNPPLTCSKSSTLSSTHPKLCSHLAEKELGSGQARGDVAEGLSSGSFLLGLTTSLMCYFTQD